MKISKDPITLRSIYKTDSSGKTYQIRDFVAREVKIDLILNEKKYLSLYASPINIRELVIGFLYSEEISEKNLYIRDIKILDEEEDKIRVYVWLDTTSENQNLTNLRESKDKILNFKISQEKIFKLYKSFQQRTNLFKLTGCFHSACLCDRDEIIFFTEDIGRHNTVDKVIGFALSNGISLNDKILMITGRITSEMVFKVGRWKIPIVVSKGAPTSLAIEFAEKNQITLIGFLRGEKLNVYSHPERIIS